MLESFFASWHFPFFMLSVLFFFALLVVSISFIPVSGSALGTFAEGFKTWCLGYDPATGEIEYIYLVMFIVQPIILSVFILAFWYKPLGDLVKETPSKAVPHFFIAFVLVGLIGVTLPAFYSSTDSGELPFPAEDLRTEITPPEFFLVNQYNQQISLDHFRGEVVMITAIYASCGETCPLILEQAQAVFSQLEAEKKEKVSLMALTMDPGKDTPEMLRMMGKHYQINGPNKHLLTGEPGKVNTVLDQLNIPRRRRGDGALNHANIFILIDKRGKIAYRFTLGDRQKNWLLKATRLLIKEKVTASEKNLSSLKYEKSQ